MGRACGPVCLGDGFGGEGDFLARDRQPINTSTAMIVGTIHLNGKRGRCRVEPGTVLNPRTISKRPRITTMTWTIEFRQLGGGFGFSADSFSIMAMEES